MNTNLQDADLIARLGGPSKVAEMLNFDKKGGAQRVQNWIPRGIPSAIKVKHPHIFMPELAPALTNTKEPATETIAPPVDPIQDADPGLRIGVQRRQGSRYETFSNSKRG